MDDTSLKVRESSHLLWKVLSIILKRFIIYEIIKQEDKKVAQRYLSIPYKIRISICAILISYLQNKAYFVGSYKRGIVK